MSQIEVPDWVVEVALLASFRVACEHTGTEFSEDEFRNARDEHDRENRNVASDMIRAALTAALGAWVVPVPQFGDACTDAVWFDGELLETSKDDPFYRTRTLYTLRQEKPDVLP